MLSSTPALRLGGLEWHVTGRAGAPPRHNWSWYCDRLVGPPPLLTGMKPITFSNLLNPRRVTAQINGLVAYLDEAELFDTSAFTGQSATASAAAIAILNDDSQQPVSGACELATGGATVASPIVAADGSSCSFAATASRPAELPASPTLTVTYQGFQQSLRFTVR